MASVATPPQPSASPAQEKTSRNKRKYRGDQPGTAELGHYRMDYPPATDCVDFDFVAPEKDERAAMAAVAAAEGINLELFTSTCDMCNSIHPTDEEFLQCQRYVSWTFPSEAHLEEILMKSLDATFGNAVSAITAMGYSEVSARATVMRAGLLYSWRERLTGFTEAAVEMLKAEGDMSPRDGATIEDMTKVEHAVLCSLVAVVTETQPFLSTADAMFCLLMSDMNVASACAMDYDSTGPPTASAEVLAQPVVGNYAESSSSSNVSASIRGPEPGVTYSGTLTAVSPSSQNAAKDDSSIAPTIPNLPSSKPSVSGNMQCVISNLKPKGHSVALSDHPGEQPFVASATRSAKDDKPAPIKRGSSKRDSLHRQKLMSFDKSSRALGSKGSLRSCKHSSSGGVVLDRKCKSFSDSAGVSLKGSSKVGKGFAVSVTQPEASVDLSFTSGLPSSSSFDKTAGNSNLTPAASTDLSLSLPSPSDGPAPSVNHDSNAAAPKSVNQHKFSYDNGGKDWLPQDRRDAIALILIQRQNDLQAHMLDWRNWAQQKVMQVARRLGKEKEELQSLRKEKAEVDRLQEERHNLEESTRKKLLEMESAIAKANGQLEKADASARRREPENAQLRIQMEAAKRHAAESAANLEELSKKDENTLKRSQYWESEKALLQEELTAEKSNLSQAQQQLEHAKEKKDHLQARWRQEETEKMEAIARVTSERKERAQIETSLRSEENFLHLKAENDMQRYKSEIRALEQQISQLKLSLDSLKVAAPRWGTDNKSYASLLSEGRKNSNAQVLAKVTVSQDLDFEDIQRDRECVMCLSEEMSVVFLPCAHQVVCAKCNDLHEKQGMKECPSCRTPIQRRVRARSADC